jgi:FixJ family two-component response regulator
MPKLNQAYVIDDDEVARRALSEILLAAGIESRLYENAQDFLDDVDDLAPGCIVSDFRMPGLDGLDLLRLLKAKGDPHPVILISGYADIALAVDALKAGAADFLQKPFTDEVVLAAVRKALDEAADCALRTVAIARRQKVFATLSPREREVLNRVLSGDTSKVIARALGISPRTVEVYRAQLMQKVGARSLPELVWMAITMNGPAGDHRPDPFRGDVLRPGPQPSA